MSRSIAEAREEFAGLVNEAEAYLETVETMARPDGEHSPIHATLLVQLLELCAQALGSARAYEYRIQLATRILHGENPTDG